MSEPILSSDVASRLYSHQQELLTRGYTILPNILSAPEVAELREVVDALYRLHDPNIDFEGLNVADGRPDGSPLENSGDNPTQNRGDVASRAPRRRPCRLGSTSSCDSGSPRESYSGASGTTASSNP